MTLVDRDLTHLPLRPSTLQLLQQRGFSTVQEVLDAKGSNTGYSDFAAELQVDLSQAVRVWHEVQQHASGADKENPRPMTASALLLQNDHQQHQRNIITFSRQVDSMLLGGVPLGELTELSGLPGCGKTQWALQLAVNVTLPEGHGGVAGRAVYIDTEGSFSPERCYHMAGALVSHINAGRQKRMLQGASDLPPVPDTFTPEGILQSIDVIRVHDEATLVAVLQALPTVLQSQSPQQLPIRLIVVDSMAFPYRAAGATEQPADYYVHRTRQLTSLAALLSHVAREHQAAVLAINQMTTKVSSNDQSSVVVPALGESWAHAVTTRLLLSTESNGQQQQQQPRRFCELTKSPRLPPARVEYCVTEQGIRDPMPQNGNKRPKTKHGQ